MKGRKGGGGHAEAASQAARGFGSGTLCGPAAAAVTVPHALAEWRWGGRQHMPYPYAMPLERSVQWQVDLHSNAVQFQYNCLS